MDWTRAFCVVAFECEERKKSLDRGRHRRDFLASARESRTGHDGTTPSAGAGAVGLLLGLASRRPTPDSQRGAEPKARDRAPPVCT